jgi:hypothetical protein
LRQFIDAAEGGEDGLAWFALDALILDDLEMLGPAGEFAAKEHKDVCGSSTTFLHDQN